MRVNPYYNKDTMNLKQLASDLEKQGYTCGLSENGDYLCVYYLCYLDCVEISLTKSKYWCVAYYHLFKDPEIYHLSTNWGVIKLLRNFLIDA